MGNQAGSSAPVRGGDAGVGGGDLHFRFWELVGLGQSSVLLCFDFLEDTVSS